MRCEATEPVHRGCDQSERCTIGREVLCDWSHAATDSWPKQLKLLQGQL